MNRTVGFMVSGALLFAGGLGLGWQWGRRAQIAQQPVKTTQVSRPAGGATPRAGRRVLYWVSPMNRNEHSNHFKKDSMNMAYVPVYAPSANGQAAPTGVAVDPRMVQTLGVRLITVKPRRLSHEVKTVGTVGLDENRLYDVNLRVPGWVVRLDARAVGDTVRKGQVLAQIYAPKLYAAESEYLIVRAQSHGVIQRDVAQAAATRLQLLGMSRAQIRRLGARNRAQKFMVLRAPVNGTVLALGARAGGYVTPGTTLFEIADLSHAWVKIALYSYQLPWVQVGDPVRLQLANGSGRVWRGPITFLYPTLDPSSRTVEARVRLADPHGQLRPGSYIQATVEGKPRTALAVPQDTILHMGAADYVMQATGQGHFLPTQVLLGPQSAGWVEIQRGLKDGDHVAEGAQFLLYAESQIQQIQSRMLGPVTKGLGGDSAATGRQARPAAGGVRP
ncbi:MAG: efflux RND transporter periplasmic adaptor subunit [Acidiferrobacteraceae bacterium]